MIDSLLVIAGGLQAGLALLLLFVLPGVALGRVVAPGATALPARIGRSLAVGLLVAALAAALLARLGLLRPTILVAVLVGLSVLPFHSRIPHLPRLPHNRAGRWRFVVGGAVGLAIVGAAVGPVVVGGDLERVTGVTWDHAAAARAIAATGGFDADVAGWGEVRPAVLSGPLAVGHLAAALELLPGDLETRLVLYRVAVLVASIGATALLLGRWLSSWVALLAAVTVPVVADRLFAPLLQSGDGISTMLVLLALWLADRALVEGSRRLVLAAVTAAGAATIVQPDTFVLVAVGTAGLTIARWVVAPGGGPESAGGLGARFGRRLGIRPRRDAAARRRAATGLGIVAGAGAVAVFGFVALSGRLPLVAARDSASPPVLVAIDEVPPGWRPSDDLGWDLHRALAGNDAGEVAPPLVPDELLAPTDVAYLAVPVVIAVLAWPRLDARRQRLVVWLLVGLALGGVVLAAGGLLGAFDARQVAGGVVRRLPVPSAAALGLLAWLIGRAIARGLRGPAPRFAGVAAAMVTAIGVALPLAAIASYPPGATGGPSPEARDAYRWIALQTPVESRILTNAATRGALAALAERDGVLDGAPPSPADEREVREATRLALGARVVFLDPAGRAAAAYLAREVADYLLVADPELAPHALGSPAFPTDLDSLTSGGRYTLVATFGEGRLRLFAVAPPA